jgi:serine protease Do
MLKKLFFVFLITSSLISKASPFRESYADIVEPLIPAVVNISIIQQQTGSTQPDKESLPEGSQYEEFFRFFERFSQMPGAEEDDNENDNNELKPISSGSGFIISPNGYIVTNYHVIEQAEKILVTLTNEQKLEAILIGFDSRTDLALLKIESSTPLDFVKFGNSDKNRVGDIILTIGNPFGFGSTVTSGIISAQARDIQAGSSNIIDNFIQTDASINKGNSGGPMFNLKGEVIGINFAIFSPSGGSVGVGFAVPSSAAKPIIDQLMQTGQAQHGWIGIITQSTSDVAEGLGLSDGEGLLISSVSAGGPADKAGIKVGDIILKYNTKKITSTTKLPRIVAGTPIGKKVIIDLMSKGKKKTTSLIVEEANTKKDISRNKGPQASLNITYGIELSPLTKHLKQKHNIRNGINGILVTTVDRKSLAYKHGIKQGDIISAVNQQTVQDLSEFLEIIDEAKRMNRKSVMLLINRSGGIAFLNMPIDKK